MTVTTNEARFTINDSPSEDVNGNRGYNAENSDTLTVTLEEVPSSVLAVSYYLYDALDDTSPLTSKNAPAVVWNENSQASITLASVNDSATVDLPASGAHSYVIRCVVAVPRGSAMFERVVTIRSGGLVRLRKTVPDESGQYSPRSDSDDQNDIIDAIMLGLGEPGLVDHGILTGLTGDDHTQYHTNARGDARYIPKSIVDAKGDIVAASADDVPARLPVGSDGKSLLAASGEAIGLQWGYPHHGDLTGLTGDDHSIYHTDARGDARYIPKSLLDAKGDLIAASADNIPARLPLGTDGKTLMAASGETTGLEWGYQHHGVLVGLTGDDHTQYILENGTRPFSAYIDVNTAAIPANPIAGKLRLYVEDIKGFPFFSFRDSTGMIRKIVRDSVFVGKNVTGVTIPAFRAVYASGSESDVPTLALAKSNSIDTMPAIGITTEAIDDDGYGRVMQVGLLENVNTSSFSAGNVVYVSPTSAGLVTATPPIYPNIRQEVGTILVAAASGSAQVISRSMINDSLTEHSGLLGLTGDDHSQYHTDARGDARYILKSIVDAKGDLISATANDTPAKLTVGADGKALMAASGEATGLAWGYQHHGDLTGLTGDDHTQYILKSLVDAKGDIIAATGDNAPTRLAVGADGKALLAASGEATGLAWGYQHHGDLTGLTGDDHSIYHNDTRGDARYIAKSLVDAKGDLIVASADNTPAKFTVGSNGAVPVAASGETVGIKWAYSQLTNTAEKTSGYTALPFENVLANPSSAGFTILAPATPSEGFRFAVTNSSTSYNTLKLDGNGNVFENGSAYYLLKESHGYVEFQYISGRWRSINPIRRVYALNAWECDIIPDGDGIGGGTNNTTAFASAMTMLAAQGGGVLYLPIGTYRKDGVTQLYNHVYIFGESSVGHSTFPGGVRIDCKNMSLVGDATAAFYEIAGNGYNVCLKNLLIIGPNVAAGSQWWQGLIGVRFRSTHTYSRLENVTCENFQNGFAVETGGYITFYKCNSRGNQCSGLTVYNGYDVKIIGGMHQDNGNYGNISITSDKELGGTTWTYGIAVDVDILDESNGYSLYVAHTKDSSFKIGRMYTATISGAYFNNTHRCTLEAAQIQHYGDGVPIVGNSIVLTDTCRNMRIVNTHTSPEGGGDISDLAPDTTYINVNGISKNERQYISQAAEPTALVGELLIFNDTDSSEAGAIYGTATGNKHLGDLWYIQKSLVDAKGDILTATADNTPARLAVGTNGKALMAASGEATGLEWNYQHHGDLTGLTGDDHTQYILKSLADAKGDVFTATADNIPARLAVGSDEKVLVANSATATGLEWQYRLPKNYVKSSDQACDGSLTTIAGLTSGALEQSTKYILKVCIPVVCPSTYDAHFAVSCSVGGGTLEAQCRGPHDASTDFSERMTAFDTMTTHEMTVPASANSCVMIDGVVVTPGSGAPTISVTTQGSGACSVKANAYLRLEKVV